MKTRRRSFVLGVGCALALALPLLAGCGDGTPGAQSADVKPGNMPDGAEWTGVYFSQLYGYLHLVQEGSTVSGKWQRPVKDRWGEIHGKVTGDVLRFEWAEYKVGGVGPGTKQSGRGYFKYSRPEGDNVDDVIVGEIGPGESEVGKPWDAIKQRNMNPDMDSIGGTGATDIGGGDWDSGNSEPESESGPAEEPEAPPPI
jgi:hypothetical protein